MIQTRLRLVFVATLVTLAAGCAWGYAGEDSKVVTEPQAPQHTEVVKLDQSPQAKQQPHDQDSTASASSDQSASADQGLPCGVATFTIERFTAEKRELKTINCVERTVVHVERTPMGATQLQAARDAGYPEGQWFLLVDPKGLRAKYVSNAELIKISKQFHVHYLDKDREHNLLIYEYKDLVR